MHQRDRGAIGLYASATKMELRLTPSDSTPGHIPRVSALPVGVPKAAPEPEEVLSPRHRGQVRRGSGLPDDGASAWAGFPVQVS